MRKQAVVERQLAADRATAFVDARNLALELADMQPDSWLDPMVAGVVLQSGESLRRLVNAWLRQRTSEGWTEPSWSQTSHVLRCQAATRWAGSFQATVSS